MIDIREMRGIAEYRAVESLQKEVWSCADLEVVPAMHMMPACEVGAILLGAFDDGVLVGFVYGFPGFEEGVRTIHSDMLAVRSSYRDRGIGRALKLAQRERALAQGVQRITWTFDPLQARNAYVNFLRLSVIADRYKRDFYGETTSALHRGTSTDRLWVTWLLDRDIERDTTKSARRIEIPSDITSLLQHDPEQAVRFRERTRHEFEEAFAKGYIVTGFERGAEMCAYLLTRKGASM
jgi:predicted GNAT superfamily acetyltransferase